MSSRIFRTISFLALLLAGTAFTLAFVSRHGQLNSQTHPAAQAAAATSPAPAVTPQAPPPGTITYAAAGNTTALAIARLHLAQSSFMTAPELEAAIRKANEGKSVFKKGQTVFVPGIEPQPIVEKSRPFPKDGEVRAIYLTGSTAGSVRGLELVRRWHQSGGNAVVFDIKDSDGTINVPFNHPLARKLTHYPITNLPKYVRYLHSLDMHVIARQALFRDDNIARNHGSLAVQSRRTHAPWLENGKLVWSDPSSKEVQAYNIALAKYIAQSGVDEIQFDYVRFPAEGDQKDAQFVFQADPKMHRDDVIAGFLERAYSELHSMGILLSLDVFGVMAWQRQVDLNHTGQDIVKMARHCDVLSPMIYPSHFFGMDGYAHPGDEPEHFIGTSMDRYQKVTSGSGVTLRPWLQAFAWRTRTYSPEYILKQVGTSRQHGGNGFLFWNAGNDYSKPFVAMPVIMANPARYLVQPHKTTVAGAGAAGSESSSAGGSAGTHL
ncbi:MAG TPA: putative glycoside hydrolase [Candidatus Angelobacter sp.]|nr:putative glycoside hydrolase [Candidatus Angelobacter sp.]